MKTRSRSQGSSFISAAVAGAVAAAVLPLALAANAPARAAVQARPVGWAGVYKTQFDNALVSGERYRSENILEIADISASASYVRLALAFFNGHQCSLHGVAERRGQSLVYRAKAAAGEPPCVLTLSRAGSKVVLHDAGGVCRMQSCGARGAYEGISFPVPARRPIRYLPRLMASSQYKEALAEYGSLKRAAP